MNEDAAHIGVAGKPFEGPARTGDRHVAHPAARLVAEAARDHLVVGEEGAVEEEGVRTRDTLVQVVGDAGAAGRIDEPSSAGLDRDADRPLADGVGLDLALFEPKRNLSRDGEELEGEARQRLERLVEADGAARNDVVAHDVENPVRADRVERGARAPDRERLALAQGEQSRRVVDVGVGEQRGGDRRTPALAFRLHRGRRQDLLAQVDRGVEQQPALAVGADREARLRARLHAPIAVPGKAADAAVTIPLRHAATPSRAENERAEARWVSGGHS